ncbi:hypothetical protein H7C18_34760, partial [Cohnella sp. CBP 2801]|nr:hypothetical protein [Cohnella zeiphila]
AAAFALVLARLAWMQLGPGRADRSASAIGRSAALQRSDSLMLDSGRGQFTDRGGKLLTGETVRALAAFPEAGMPRGTDETLGRLAAILGTDKARLTAWLNGLKTAEVWREGDSPEAHGLSEEEEEAVRKLDLIGVAVLPYRNRYPEDSPVSPLHAIGYVSQNPQRMKDVYGQKLADRELRSTDRI